jgi:hypothetical protein
VALKLALRKKYTTFLSNVFAHFIETERITMPKRGVNWAFLKINTN